MNLRRLARGKECRKVSMSCAVCHAQYRKRSDRVRTPDYCCLDCRKIATARSHEERCIECARCGVSFIPRIYQLSQGQGRYCSLKCSTTATENARNNATARARAMATYKANGHDKDRLKGEENPLWTGGPKAARKRSIQSGNAARTLAAYRRAHPERVREWARGRRSNMKLSRLPYGTIPRLLRAQKYLCVYCRASLKGGYHVDHIMPLKLGGKHESQNIQLLCPPCNLSKSARHPVVFAQSRGMLL